MKAAKKKRRPTLRAAEPGMGAAWSAVKPRKDGAEYTFTAKLARFAPLFGVDVPGPVSGAEGRANVPVVVRLEGGEPFRATMVAAGGGRHRLFFNADVRAAAKVKAGDRVTVWVRVDRGPRQVPVPPDLADALEEEGVRTDWEALPPGKREHILRWIEQAAHDETRAKRVVRAVEEALARREKRIDRGV